MKKTLLTLPVLLCAGSLFGSDLPQLPSVEAWRKNSVSTAEKKFSPVLHDNFIQFGSKVLQMSPDGRIKCITPEHGELLSLSMYFHVVRNGQADHNWKKKAFDAKKSRFYRKGNQYFWDLYYGDKDVPSSLCIQQILTVLPDGVVQFKARYSLPKKTATHDFRNFWLTFSMQDSVWTGETLSLADGKNIVLTRDLKRLGSNPKLPDNKWVFGGKTPAKKFAVQIRQKEMRELYIFRYPDRSTFNVGFHTLKRDALDWFTAYFDFTGGTEPKKSGETRGGVNFKMQENMTLPDISSKNMITNPSFECGFEGWGSPFRYAEKQWDWVPYELDSTTAYDGKYSLKCNAHPFRWVGGNPNLGPLNIVANPGTYTLSFYAKGEQGKKTGITVWAFDFHRDYWSPIKGCKKQFTLTPEWKRYSFSFKMEPGRPMLPIQFAPMALQGQSANLWIDAVQLERGNKLTDYVRPPAEGYLITSSPENFLSSKEKINGKLRITTAKPNASGKIRVIVKNFFDETLLDETKKFKTGSDRTTGMSLPLDSLPGLGVFVVKCEFKLDDGSSYYDYRRYARIEYQNMPRLNKQMFSADYGGEESAFTYKKMIDRWKKLGIGARYHHRNLDKSLWDFEESQGYIPYCGSLLSYIRVDGKKIVHFCIVNRPEKEWKQTLDDPKILIRDYHLEAGGKVTPEYQAKLKEAVKTMVKQYPHVKYWDLGGELTCKMHNEWWGKGFTDRDTARTIAMLLKPFVEGVKEANPKAKVFQDDPANMSPRGGIAETDLLLEECNKLGVKFDIIGIHPYRFSPENPDTDSDAQLFFKVLKKHGYDKTKVIWPEGMHWGPFEIPQWGTQSSTWQSTPRTWAGHLSYDMGWTEKKSAAWYARAWLVSLKYRDRVLCFVAGNCRNNNIMDYQMTPYAAQLIPNTLSCILGNAEFRKDIRFAPFIRTYVFEDDQKRPVAVIWNHHEDVDNGRVDAPYVTADFGNSLESVLDLMNSPRKITPGKMRFQVNSFPLFFVGKPGTLKQMIAAFDNAEPDAGKLFNPITISATPENSTDLKLTIRNTLSKDFKGTLNGIPLMIPAAGEKIVTLKLPKELQSGAISQEKMDVTLKSTTGAKYSYEVNFNAFKAVKITDSDSIDTVNWDRIPAVPFPKYKDQKTSGKFRLAWNKHGFYIEICVKDPKFVHVEYPVPNDRWCNDCVQIFFDTLANARDRQFKGFDEDDYSYAIFPNSKGDAARMYRYQSVESQIGLATQAPPDKVFADDIPCRFSNKDGVLTYRTFIPGKYLLPIKLRKNCAFGLGLFAMNSDEPRKTTGKALTIASDGGSCFERPHMYPVVILDEK